MARGRKMSGVTVGLHAKFNGIDAFALPIAKPGDKECYFLAESGATEWQKWQEVARNIARDYAKLALQPTW